MRHKAAAALAAIMLLLPGCAPKEVATPAPSPSEVIKPASTATPTPTPTPTPESTEEVKELWGFPIDDTHDAFEVSTGGKLGTVLVTVERGEENTESELGGYHYTFCIWDKSDLTTPIQIFEETEYELGGGELMDANFDGYTDFLYVWNPMSINWPFSLYIWDEEQGQFIFETSFMGRGVSIDKETQTIACSVHYTNYSGADEIYHWENGELICFRREEYELLDNDLQLTEYVTYEWIDGEWQEISREEHAMAGM